ncbi:hypothetical protein [Flavobacterium lindanitolerans]|uniref:Uncharacterized protein n=1 Tax=Flavobacterium lindanitolerans TaxID=428988 RepID=A0A497U5V5_9FLAO|nr:hypothetical protein [Flavobacterium lindanitolerans]PKW29935.1 hypothetical protein B0G92_1583 [Flavobacterium lindanitolerans]RLJ24275.1 hypothetical protein CLV50_2155 [Flavobacterium lindanitolerans]
MKFLQALFILFAVNATAQSELGIGIATIKYTSNSVLNLYAAAYDKEPKQIIQFYQDEVTGSPDIRDIESVEKWLKPEGFFLDYDQLVFRCKSEERFWIEVIVNNETGESYWIRKTKSVDLDTWEGFLKNAFMISRNSFPQEIKAQPNDSARTIPFDGEDCFQVKSMKGDWIQIFTGSHCDDDGNPIKSGWIRWKQENEILIDYFLTS